MTEFEKHEVVHITGWSIMDDYVENPSVRDSAGMVIRQDEDGWVLVRHPAFEKNRFHGNARAWWTKPNLVEGI